MSPVIYNDREGRFEVFEAICCNLLMYDTGCDAPTCRGYVCEECGQGCDAESAPLHGDCVMALDEESDEEYINRINRERAVLGLSLIQPETD